MDYPLYLDAGDVQFFGKCVDSLEQIFTCFRVNVRPSGWDFNCKKNLQLAVWK